MIARARTFGLSGLCLVEHAPQLYCEADDFWVGNHIRKPKLWREAKHPRMAEFRERILPLRGDFVRVGLEVELDADGRLTLQDEDRDWPDLLVGAVHFLEAGDVDSLSDKVLVEQFMQACRGLLAAGVDVLAHPWRLFGRRKKPVPLELYEQLADMLAGAGTAAEINFHIQRPGAEFFRLCIQRGVKIAFGSDAHRLHDVGNLWAHLEMLEEFAGTKDPAELAKLLFVPQLAQEARPDNSMPHDRE
jgi:histidinol phosphatase-like PHP family hydrolase